MTLKPVLPFLLLALHSSLLGQETSLMQKGNEALASKLWEMAAYHFENHLANDELNPQEKSDVAIRLCEAWIRGNKAADALILLDEAFLSTHPETPFWKGQALASMGRFADAVGILKPLIANAATPHRQEAGLTVASLELALAKPQTALKTLSLLAVDASPNQIQQIRLRQALILIDLERIDEARETLPQSDDVVEAERSLVTFIEANILLREQKFDDAIERFQSLINNPKNLSMSRFHAAVIGLADALNAKGSAESSADFLLNFIQDHPDSPQLEEIFKRLLEALPDNPTINDPILERLTEWIPPSEIPSTGLILTDECTAVSAWPSETETRDLLAFSLFTRATGLRRLNTSEAKVEALRLLTRLRLENPRHFLADRALLMMARWNMQDEEHEKAIHILTCLQENATSPLLKGQAAYLKAASSQQQGNSEVAAKLFIEASTLLNGIAADTAQFNAALVQLTDASSEQHAILTLPVIQNRQLAADLQLERALAIGNPNEKRTAIENFLIQHPEHPRAAEARLAVAKAALDQSKPDISFAQAQIETIEANPETIITLTPAEIALVKLRIADLTGDAEKTIASARTLVADFPSAPQATEASFILGRSLFSTGNYNDARITLEKLTSSITNPEREQAAWVLAARAAALVPTSQSQQEALVLFDQAIKIDGPVTALAKLEKARLMIDMSRLTEAEAFLKDWLDSLAENDPLHVPAGLLLGEAIYAQGNINPNSLTEALGIYDELTKHTEKFSATYDRLQYLRGLVLEQLPDPENPSLKRDKQAFIAYYSVLERDTPPEQWQYFELCGFRALALLEKARRWPAAIACAKKTASFNGPRAEEAAARAHQIQLKYMIWED